MAVSDEKLLAALQGGGSQSELNWTKALQYLAEIAEAVANVAGQSAAPGKHMRVYVVNDSLPVELPKTPLPVAVDDYTGTARKLFANYGKDSMSLKSQLTEVKYWRNVYGLGGDVDLRQALPVCIVDAARASKTFKNSVAVKVFK